MAEKQSILGRIAQLTRANINALLDRAEDPEKMLDQLVRDYTNSIAEAEEAADDDGAVRPRTRTGGDEPIATGFDGPAGVGIIEDAVLDVVRVAVVLLADVDVGGGVVRHGISSLAMVDPLLAAVA